MPKETKEDSGLSGNGSVPLCMVDSEEGCEVFEIEIEQDDELVVGPGLDAIRVRKVISDSYTNFDKSKVTPLNYEMYIRITADTPFFCPPRRLSSAEKREVDVIIKNLMIRGIIKHSDPPYASPIVLTKKKSGEIQLCVDYRALNKHTIRDNYPLPLIEDCLEYFAGKKVSP